LGISSVCRGTAYPAPFAFLGDLGTVKLINTGAKHHLPGTACFGSILTLTLMLYGPVVTATRAEKFSNFDRKLRKTFVMNRTYTRFLMF
jgi:hypothetical protein